MRSQPADGVPCANDEVHRRGRPLAPAGRVERIESDPDNVFINSMARKHLGQDVNPWNKPDEERVVMVIRPERTTRMG
jgi:hypothetical protein